LLRGVREGRSYVVTVHGRPIARLEPIRKTIGGYNFAGQYQLARPVGRRPRQGRLVPALGAGRIAGEIRAHRAELGHRQQGDGSVPTCRSVTLDDINGA